MIRANNSWRPAALLGPLALAVAGCGSVNTVQPIVTATPVPPTPTVVVGFHVDVTAVPTPPGPLPTPTATSPPFRVPAGPFLVISPSSGPPSSRTVRIRAGHLPPNYTVLLGFSPGVRTAPLTTTAYTDGHGNLRASYDVPASPPGSYRMTVLADGVTLAVATYHVISHALISVTSNSGTQLSISGQKFLSNSRVLLVAYPLTKPRRHIVLGAVSADGTGSFLFLVSGDRVPPGAYRLRAWSQGTLAAQVAETYFQVVV